MTQLAIKHFNQLARSFVEAIDFDMLVRCAFGLPPMGELTKVAPWVTTIHTDITYRIVESSAFIGGLGGEFNFNTGYCGMRFLTAHLRWPFNIVALGPHWDAYSDIYQDYILDDFSNNYERFDVIMHTLIELGRREITARELIMLKLSMR